MALFKSVQHVMKAEKILKAAGVPHKIIPVPKNISSDCGVCIRITPEQEQTLLNALRSFVEIEEIRNIR